MYTVDTTPPQLTRWYLDRSTFHLHMLFTEPVHITNITSFLFTTSTTAGGPRLRITADIEYLAKNTHVVLRVHDICVRAQTTQAVGGGTSVSTCVQAMSFRDYILQLLQLSSQQVSTTLLSTTSFFVSFDETAVQDFAYVPNTIVPIFLQGAKRIGDPGIAS